MEYAEVATKIDSRESRYFKLRLSGKGYREACTDFENYVDRYKQSNPSVHLNLHDDIQEFARYLLSKPFTDFPSIRCIARTLDRLQRLQRDYDGPKGDARDHSARFRLIKNNIKRVIQQHRLDKLTALSQHKEDSVFYVIPVPSQIKNRK